MTRAALDAGRSGPRPGRRRLLLGALAAGLSACTEKTPQPELIYSASPRHTLLPSYRLAPHPLYNPQKLSQALQPLVDHLNSVLPGSHIELESSRDYQAFESKVARREPDIIMPNPWQTLQALKSGYEVLAMWGEPEDFKGLLLVRKDSTIRTSTDLKGKSVSYPSPTALAAAIMPQYRLHRDGVDVLRDITNLYVGSQDSSILNVYQGHVAAGATWPPPWRLFQKNFPKEAAELSVLWETESLVNNSVMTRNDLPEPVRDTLRQTLLGLHQSAQGQRILAQMETTRFLAATHADYDRVHDYVTRFEKEVRPVGLK